MSVQGNNKVNKNESNLLKEISEKTWLFMLFFSACSAFLILGFLGEVDFRDIPTNIRGLIYVPFILGSVFCGFMALFYGIKDVLLFVKSNEK